MYRLKKHLESPLDCKEIKPVNPKGNQPWRVTGRTDAEVEVPILWPPNAKSWLIRKDPEAGKDWRQEEKGCQRMRWLGSIVNSMDVNFNKLRERVEDRGAWCGTVHEIRVRHNLETEKQNLQNSYTVLFTTVSQPNHLTISTLTDPSNSYLHPSLCWLTGFCLFSTHR